jgi:ATP-dependent Clp protease ATP-binding subunit ClpC
MFERFSEAARRALFFARYEASMLGSRTIEAEHLLLGLIRDGKGAVAEAFEVAGLSDRDARAQIEAQAGMRERLPTSVEIPFSGAMQRILRYAMEQADALKHREIGREHLLLGILTDGSSFSARMLKTHGITVESFRDRLTHVSGDVAHPGSGAAADSSGPLGVIASLEDIRALVDELARHCAKDAMAQTLIREIHLHLTALRRQIGGT